jgi:hypothetical protein
VPGYFGCRVREFLGSGDLEQVLKELRKIPSRKAINPLIADDPLSRSLSVKALRMLGDKKV